MRQRLALLVLLVAVAPHSLAQQPAAASTYTIELVVFVSTGDNAGEELTTTGVLSAEEADGGGASASGPVRLLQVLPANQRRLGGVVSRLNASGAYRVIAHSAWQQTAAAFNSSSPLPLERLGLATNGLSGAAYLQRGEYLHLGLNLSHGSGDDAVAIRERRRALLNERMYFDHPAFGVIALVTPAAR